MSLDDAFPVILLSVANKQDATNLISEIINNEPLISDERVNEADSVWRIVNKYYTADVQFHLTVDGQQLVVDPSLIQAHIIYLTEGECVEDGEQAVSICENRWEYSQDGTEVDRVRIVVAKVDKEPVAVAEWSRRRHYELVPLCESHPEEPPMQRLRDSLQAHVWPGLVASASLHAPLCTDRRSSASSEESWGSWQDGAGAEEEAEAAGESLARALGAVQAVRAMPVGAARAAAAERLLAAVCRLGDPL